MVPARYGSGLLPDWQSSWDVTAAVDGKVGEKSVFSNKMESQSFNTDQFENSVGGTALDIIRNLPSVNINIEGDITLRGSNGILILIDGKLIQGDPNNLDLSKQNHLSCYNNPIAPQFKLTLI